MQRIVLKWLRWRYGGDVHALKPPLGYHWSQHRRLSYKAAYWLKRALHEVENRLFQRYGKPMRDNWERAFPADELLDAQIDAIKRFIAKENERIDSDRRFPSRPHEMDRRSFQERRI